MFKLPKEILNLGLRDRKSWHSVKRGLYRDVGTYIYDGIFIPSLLGEHLCDVSGPHHRVWTLRS